MHDRSFVGLSNLTILPYLSRNIRKSVREFTLWYSPISFINTWFLHLWWQERSRSRV